MDGVEGFRWASVSMGQMIDFEWAWWHGVSVDEASAQAGLESWVGELLADALMGL